MKHLLMMIGEEILIHQNFKQYIFREYERDFKEISDFKILSKCDKNLPFLLEGLLKEYDFITIFASSQHFTTLSKILATLDEDTLILKEGILVPSKVEDFHESSFLSIFEHCKINLIKADINKKLPKSFSTFKQNFVFFYLKDIDEDSAKLLLDTLVKSYEVSIESSAILENLIRLKAGATQYGKIDEFIVAVRNLFGKKFFLQNPIEFITSKLKENNLKISFAESCTAGLCASNLAKIDGISQIFDGSVVSYSNRLKHEWLGINENILENGGEYSERCVYFMLKGVFKTTNCDFALATSGVAGENDEGNVKTGTIYIGAMYKDGTFLQETLHLDGDRNFIREQASLAAFCLILKLKPEFF